MKQGTASIAKALAVLECIGLSGGCSLNEIAVEVRLPKPTLLRVIGALIENGFVRRTAHGKYAVGLKMWRMGCNAIDSEAVRDDVIPILRDLVTQTGENSHYAVYEDGHSVYIEKVDGLHPIRSYTSVGGRSPAYATATGKVLLAWRDETEIADVARHSKRFTEATSVGLTAISRQLAEVRKRGYAVNRGEWRVSVWGVAAPVFDRYGKVRAAIGITGPRDRVEPSLKKYVKYVCAAAVDISRRHGSFREAS